MFSKRTSSIVIALLLIATLLMGLGRVATLPPFEGSDETAHYSRIEAAAFAPVDAKAYFISTDVMGYYRHGPMSTGWIFNRTLMHPDPALKKGENPEKTYADYSDFFRRDSLKEYIQRYRTAPGPASYTATTEENWQYQHPALYYLLMGRVLRAIPDMPMIQRLLVLRSVSFLLAFTGFVIGIVATRRHLELRKIHGAHAIAVFGAAYPFLMPVFFADFGRLGNDSLCLLLFSLMWALLLWHLRRPREIMIWPMIGIVAGYSWLTKAFMVPIAAGAFLFMALQPVETEKKTGRIKLLWLHLRPALASGIFAVIVGGQPYLSLLQGKMPGSVEMNGWLHGKGFVDAGAGTPWDKIAQNLLYMMTSAVYNFTDMTLSHVGEWAIMAMLMVLLVILGRWVLSLPRDPRREEWLPFYPLLPLLAGLCVHGVMAAAAYRAVGVTPGYYVHVAAPALALALGAALTRLHRQRAGWAITSALLGSALIGNVAIMAARMALFTGCARFTDLARSLNVEFGDTLCKPATIYLRLGVLAWPGPGLACLGLSLALLAVAVGLIFRERELEI